MKLTKQQLKQIIKEEMEAVLREEEKEEARRKEEIKQALEFYKNYAANYRWKGKPAPLDLSKHVPQQDGPQGPYMLPRFARTGNFIRRAEEELGKPYEEIKDAILSGLGYRGE